MGFWMRLKLLSIRTTLNIEPTMFCFKVTAEAAEPSPWCGGPGPSGVRVDINSSIKKKDDANVGD